MLDAPLLVLLRVVGLRIAGLVAVHGGAYLVLIFVADTRMVCTDTSVVRVRMACVVV